MSQTTELAPIDIHKAIKPQYSNHEAVKSVMNIFADCHKAFDAPQHDVRCLHATVALDLGQLVEVAKAACPDGYNNFNHKRLAKVIERLIGDPASIEQAKAWAKDYTVLFGREGSPVLYVRFGRSRLWIKNLLEIAKASKADEVSIEPDGSLRLWWD